MSPDSNLVARVRRHVDLLAGVIGPRHLGNLPVFEAAAAYVEQELAGLGESVTREVYQVDGANVANLCLERRGTTKPAEIVILGAHYDTIPTTPGADDNASAVAALLEAARLLHGVPTPRTLRFVSFACEEMPYFATGSMGSQVHARGCRQRGERVVGMVCLEMLGYYLDGPGTQRRPDGIPRWLHGLLPSRGNFLASVGNWSSFATVLRFRQGFRRASRLPLFSVNLPERIKDIRRSDNSSFWDEGYPAIMVTDTSYLRNPHYHQPTDTPDTLDYRRLAQATVGVAGGVLRLAGGTLGACRRLREP